MKRILIIAALLVIVALPFVLRPKQEVAVKADDILVVVSPHNEAIRYEFARGFVDWYRAKTGRTVSIDWRILGGTSEIARFLEGQYVTAFENFWRHQGKPWSSEVQAGFQNGRLPADVPAIVREARQAFLASDVGCGIDVFFGGGTFDFDRQVQAGRLVDSGLLQAHPDWFTDAVVPQNQGGQTYWQRDGLWIGTVLSTYGIIFNRDALQRLGIEREPDKWEDLADPRLEGEVALADPTKSGSVAQAFENIIQQQMQRRLAALRSAGARGDEVEARAVREGWAEGMKLLQRVGANSRYFTDTSQKPPIDVASGNCAVGLCIDFYGRQQQEAVRRRDRSERVGYVSPPGGSSASVDPIGLLRGAPNREVAVAFIEYVMSIDGQKLWDFKVGAPGGPERFPLRRQPVRKDIYTNPEWRQYMSDPESPYAVQDPLTYRDAWTGRIFREMAFVIRMMCQEPHVELASAWRAIHEAAEPAKSRALAVMQDVSAVSYERINTDIKQALGSKDKVDEVRMARELTTTFRQNYARAERIARGAE